MIFLPLFIGLLRRLAGIEERIIFAGK